VRTIVLNVRVLLIAMAPIVFIESSTTCVPSDFGATEVTVVPALMPRPITSIFESTLALVGELLTLTFFEPNSVRFITASMNGAPAGAPEIVCWNGP
jgi:hypothetical protein